jgi:hypothetical protein
MLAAPEYLAAPRDLIAARLAKGDTNIRFSRQSAAFPWRSHAAWIFSQMLRWGQVDGSIDPARALECYRPDLFRTAASHIGMSAPLIDSKVEGAHDVDWTLPGSRGPIPMLRDVFQNGPEFHPDSLLEYAASFAITRLTG